MCICHFRMEMTAVEHGLWLLKLKNDLTVQLCTQFRGEELEGLCVEELYQIVREVEAGLHRVPTTKVGWLIAHGVINRTRKSLRIHNVELVPDLTLLPNTMRKPQLFPNSTGSRWFFLPPAVLLVLDTATLGTTISNGRCAANLIFWEIDVAAM